METRALPFFAYFAMAFMEVAVMVIRNKEYYTQFDEEMNRDHRALDYHIRQAENYKRIYQLTRGRSGVYVLLNKWAKKMNQIHCDKGFKIAKLNMAWCLYEMMYLQNYIQKGEEP